MNRSQLAHILRAAATIADDPNILVIGSQSILGTYDESELPQAAIASVEVDVAFLNDDAEATKAMDVDGAIGELSGFHQLYGIYGQGVEVKTATLPRGWRDRVVDFAMLSALPARARCLDPHDLVIAKLVAHREKDMEFTGALIEAGLISTRTLRDRARELESSVVCRRVLSTISGFEPRRGCEIDF